LHDLGRCFGDRYQRLGDQTDFESAHKCYKEAAELTPHPNQPEILWDLAVSFGDRYHKFKDPNDLEAVHFHYSTSFHTFQLAPESSWTAALNWALFAGKLGASQCLTAYSTAFNMLPEIIWIGHSILTRHAALRRLTIGEAASNAVRACRNLSRLDTAVEFMEQATATVLQQILQLRTDIDDLSLGRIFRSISFELYDETLTDPGEILDIVKRRNLVLARIRQEPGLEHFLLPKPYNILQCASQGGPVVILNSHQDDSDAIIIPDPTSDPIHVPLLMATLDQLESQKTLLKELLDRCNLRTRGEAISSRLFGQQERFTSKTMQERFTEMLSWLWIHVVAPVYQVLESVGAYF
jgi:tetratricopeptide (TPR) repeat protein